MNDEELIERIINLNYREFGAEIGNDLKRLYISKEQELDQYKNNWKELKKAVKQIEKDVCDGITDEHLTTLEMTEIFLDKMKELEGE